RNHGDGVRKAGHVRIGSEGLAGDDRACRGCDRDCAGPERRAEAGYSLQQRGALSSFDRRVDCAALWEVPVVRHRNPARSVAFRSLTSSIATMPAIGEERAVRVAVLANVSITG